MDIQETVTLTINSDIIIIDNEDDIEIWIQFRSMYKRYRTQKKEDSLLRNIQDINHLAPSIISAFSNEKKIPMAMRTVDYAIVAAIELGGYFRVKDLITKMEALGWKSTASNKFNTVSSSIRENASFSNIQRGIWEYNQTEEEVEENDIVEWDDSYDPANNEPDISFDPWDGMDFVV